MLLFRNLIMKIKLKKKSAVSGVNKNNKDNLLVWLGRLYINTIPLQVAEGFLLLLVATFIFVNPSLMVVYFSVIIGLGLLLFGLFRVCISFIKSKNKSGGLFDLFLGLINLMFGIVFCVYPRGATVGLVDVFSVLFVFKSLCFVIFSCCLARAKFGWYRFSMMFSLLMLMMSVVLFKFSFSSMYCLALFMLIYAIGNVYMFFELLRLRRRIG